MDHVTIEENNVVERYLMDRLAAAEATLFEDHYLDCSDCLDKLELSKRLYQGLKDVAAEDGTQLAQAAILTWLLRRGRPFQAMLAAALLAVVILPWAMLAPELSRRGQALAPQARTPVYSLSPERSGPGEEPSTRISLGSAPEWVVLALQPPPSNPAEPPQYRVALHWVEGEPLWQSGPLEPDATGRVTLSVHSTWLEAADYEVLLDVLTPEGEARFAARFAFQVRREK